MPTTRSAARRKPAASAFLTLTVPPVGAEWPGEGGIYAGIIRAEDGTLAHLILGPEREEPAGWNACVKWAAGIELSGHSDFSLPTSREQRLLFANLPEQFQQAWYWSGEQLASAPSYAWCQGFGLGYQDDHPKDNRLRARAVRRLVIR